MGEGEGKREKGPSKASLNPQDQFLPTSPTQFLALPSRGIIYHIMNLSRINPRIPSQPQQSHYPVKSPWPSFVFVLVFLEEPVFYPLEQACSKTGLTEKFLVSVSAACLNKHFHSPAESVWAASVAVCCPSDYPCLFILELSEKTNLVQTARLYHFGVSSGVLLEDSRLCKVRNQAKP